LAVHPASPSTVLPAVSWPTATDMVDLNLAFRGSMYAIDSAAEKTETQLAMWHPKPSQLISLHTQKPAPSTLNTEA